MKVKASLDAFEGTLIISNWREERAEDQAPNLIIRVALLKNLAPSMKVGLL